MRPDGTQRLRSYDTPDAARFKWLFKRNGLCIARVCKKIDKISSIVCMLLWLQPWSFLKHLIYFNDKITNRSGLSLYSHRCWNITDLPASEEERLREPAIEKWAIKLLLNAVVVFLLFFHFICSLSSSSGTPNWIQTNKRGAYARPPAVEHQQNTAIHTSCQSVSSASVCAGELFEPLGQPQRILFCS